eukprot:263346-Amphidinium_carterae.1
MWLQKHLRKFSLSTRMAERACWSLVPETKTVVVLAHAPGGADLAAATAEKQMLEVRTLLSKALQDDRPLNLTSAVMSSQPSQRQTVSSGQQAMTTAGLNLLSVGRSTKVDLGSGEPHG